MDIGQRILVFDKFGLAIDKRHKHPTDDGAYWKPATLVDLNPSRETATIRWDHGGTRHNVPLTEMKTFGS